MLEDGVYFGLPEDEYHGDPALGSTDIRNLLLSPAEYWWYSWMNPLRPKDKETPAQVRGTAFHTFILLGEDAFHANYVRGLKAEEHPDALRLVDQLKEACKSFGLSTTGNKPDLVKRLKERVPKLKLWDAMEAELDATGKTVLPADIYDEIIVSTKMITMNPSLAECFVDGMPEVSVFWTENGVRVKARFDYLKIGGVSDLKSVANILDQKPHRAMLRKVGNERLDIQASHYLNARARLPRLVKDGRIHGDVDRTWLGKVALTPDYGFTWVFYFTGGPPIARGLHYPRGSGNDSAAQAQINDALETYRQHWETYGDGAAWIDKEPVQTLSDSDMPSWVY